MFVFIYLLFFLFYFIFLLEYLFAERLKLNIESCI